MPFANKYFYHYVHEMIYSLFYWVEVSGASYQNFGLGFPGGIVVENLPANSGDTGSSPGLGRFHMPRSN